MLKLNDALVFADQFHTGEMKKGTSIPFIYHPLAVASLVLKYGGTEVQAKAALLHDTLGSEKASLKMIESQFGADVSRIVSSFIDPETPNNGKSSWQEQKKAYLEKISQLDEECLLVVACEEFHDGSELLHDLRYQGATIWARYPAHNMEVFWYYRELLSVFHKKLKTGKSPSLVSEFGQMVRALKEITLEGRPF